MNDLPISPDPCPFCGGVELTFCERPSRSPWTISVECVGCKAIGPAMPNEHMASMAWNKLRVNGRVTM